MIGFYGIVAQSKTLLKDNLINFNMRMSFTPLVVNILYKFSLNIYLVKFRFSPKRALIS